MINWSGNLPNLPNQYIYEGFTSTEWFSKMLTHLKTIYEDIEIHVNTQTCACTYINNLDFNVNILNNLKLICNDEEMFQAIACIKKGSFDLKRKKFWINDVESVDIVINKTVGDGYSYIVHGDKIVGYYEHAEY